MLARGYTPHRNHCSWPGFHTDLHDAGCMHTVDQGVLALVMGNCQWAMPAWPNKPRGPGAPCLPLVVELLFPPLDVLLVLPEVVQGLLLAQVVQRREVPRRHVLRHVRVAVGLCCKTLVYCSSTLYDYGIDELDQRYYLLSTQSESNL